MDLRETSKHIVEANGDQNKEQRIKSDTNKLQKDPHAHLFKYQANLHQHTLACSVFKTSCNPGLVRLRSIYVC